MCMVKQYVCRKMVEYCGEVGSGGRENISFTIYYWWPHEKRHRAPPEKPLKTSSLYTFRASRRGDWKQFDVHIKYFRAIALSRWGAFGEDFISSSL